MTERTVALEKADQGPPSPSPMREPVLRAYWRGVLDGCIVAYTTGIVDRGARAPVNRTFATEAEAAAAFEALIAAQLKKGFEPVPAVAVAAAAAPRTAPDSRPSPRLQFHAKLLTSLDVTPRVSAAAQAIIAERERVCGVTFPASVKEWFSVEGVFSLFRTHTNQDELVTNEHLEELEPLAQLAQLGDPPENAQGYLRIAVENQGVVGWYVKLDGTSDPAVVHNDDDWESPLDEVAWVSCAPSFSEFLRDMMLERSR